MKLSIREKIACSISGMTNIFHFQMIQMFLLFFYTDIMKISPGFVAMLFLLVRLLNAITGPFFAVIIDKVHLPWGKYKPWILISAIPTGILGWLTFTSVPLSLSHKMIYVVITYCLYSMMMTITGIAIAGLTPAVTKNIQDRISLGSYGYILMMTGAMAVSIGARPFYRILGDGNDAKGLSLLMGIVSILGIMIAIYQVMIIKERHVNINYKNEKILLKDMLKAVIKNKTAMIVYINTFSVHSAHGIRSAITILYFKYYFNNEGLMIVMGIFNIIPVIIGVLFSAKITRLLGIKKNITLSAILQIISMFIVVLIPANTFGVVIYIVSSSIAGLFSGFASPAQGLMMPAAMDYTELTTGKNVNSFMGSINGLMQNIATALSGAIAAGVLAFVGYIPDMVQNNTTVLGLKLLMSVIPAVILLPTLCLFFFDLTEDKQRQIGKALIERREGIKILAED